MKTMIINTSAALLLALFTLPAFAANQSFLSNTARSFFTKEDWQLSKAAQKAALNHYKDGQAIAWNNPRTGSHGVFFPFRTTRQNGEVCRQLKMVNTAQLVHEKATFRFCKFNDEWKII